MIGNRLYPTAMAMVLGSASTALAAGGRDDTSGIFVWAFLGFCALIIVAQLVPAALVLFGIVKGVAGKPVPKEVAAAAGRNEQH